MGVQEASLSWARVPSSRRPGKAGLGERAPWPHPWPWPWPLSGLRWRPVFLYPGVLGTTSRFLALGGFSRMDQSTQRPAPLPSPIPAAQRCHRGAVRVLATPPALPPLVLVGMEPRAGTHSFTILASDPRCPSHVAA